jgi:site-specific recombinase XerD
LAAIRSLFRWVALRDPDNVNLASRVLAIPVKRGDKPLVGYLTQAEVEALLAVPDRASWTGQRDHALLLTIAKVLQQWRQRQAGHSAPMVFPSLRGNALTRDSVHYLLGEVVRVAIAACPSLATKRVSPHVVRHSTAMHLLQSGVDITVIALWLGHEDVQTTHVYLQADLAMKEKALEKLTPPETKAARFKPGDELLAFLASL